jgi:hypothetical protein
LFAARAIVMPHQVGVCALCACALAVLPYTRAAYWNGNPFFIGSFESHLPAGDQRALAKWFPKDKTEHGMHGEWAWSTHMLPRGAYDALVSIDEAREMTYGVGGSMEWVHFTITHPWSTVRLSYNPVSRHVDALVVQNRPAFTCDGMRLGVAVTPYPRPQASKSPCWFKADDPEDLQGEPQLLGGTLNITVLAANFLPNLDFIDSLLGGGSDPYLSATVNGVTKNSTYERNTQNPRWNGAFGNTVEFGRVVGGMPIDIKLYDKDAGLELFDDLLGEAQVHVIKCSALYPPRDDVYWSTLKRREFPGTGHLQLPPKKCREQMWVSLKPGYPCIGTNMTNNGLNQFDQSLPWQGTTEGTPCLLIRQEVIPFNVTVDAGHIFGKSASPSNVGNKRYPIQWIAGGRQSIQTQTSVAGDYSKIGRPTCNMRDFVTLEPMYYETGDKAPSSAELLTSPNTAITIAKTEEERSEGCADNDDAMTKTLAYFAEFQKKIPCARVNVVPIEWTGVKTYLTGDGSPFMDRAVEEIDGTYLPYRSAWGGIFVRTYHDDRNDEQDNTSHARLKDYVSYHANMPSDSYIFVDPITYKTNLIPTWLTESGAGETLTFPGDGGWVRKPELRMMPDRKKTYVSSDGGSDWKAFIQSFGANVKVTLGGYNFGVEDKIGGRLGVRTNMYITTVRMQIPAFNDDNVVLTSGFDAQAQQSFGLLALVFGVPFFAFMCCAWRFIAVVLEYKEEFLTSYLAKQGPLRSEKERMAIGWLFVERTWGYGEFWTKHPPLDGFVEDATADEWRSNIYCATQMMWILLAFPVALFVTWCVVVMYIVTPALLGCAMLLVGGGFMFIAFAFLMWDRNSWRMDANTATLFVLAFACLLFFLITTMFADAQAVTFFCVTCVSMTLNVMPMSILAFIHNPELGQNLEALHPEKSKQRKRDDADQLLSLLRAVEDEDEGASTDKHGSANARKQIQNLLTFQPNQGGVEALLHETLGPKVYSVDSAIPEFKLADPLDWLASALADPTQKLLLTVMLYAVAFVVMFIYAVTCSLDPTTVLITVFTIFLIGAGTPVIFGATIWYKSTVMPAFCAGIAEVRCIGSIIAVTLGVGTGIAVGSAVGALVGALAAAVSQIAATFGPDAWMWAWQNLITLVILDTAMMLLKRNPKCKWGPGTVTLYFALTRACLALWSGEWYVVERSQFPDPVR